MKYLRTPDERFTGLPDYDYQPHYVEVDDTEGGHLRLHYLDVGPADATPILLMHGEPTWSFLYRKMIPALVDAGYRVLAPDLIGFGRSDKPTRQGDYTYARHVGWIESWLKEIDVRNITAFFQDWGGLIGLRVLAANPERFERLLVSNTNLPTGEIPMPDSFMDWLEYVKQTDELPIGAIISKFTQRPMTDAEVAGYDAPFPDQSYKAGADVFPFLVPLKPDDPGAAENRDAWNVLEAWDKPTVTAFSDGDPITAGVEKIFQERIPGCAGLEHPTLVGSGHFLQEEAGPELAKVILDLIATT